MADTRYYDLLCAGLDDALTVTRVVHGVSWTAAVLSDGRTGVAMHTEGESFPRMFESLEGLPLTDAGKALLSWNLEEASEAHAAVNAFYNHRGCPGVQPGAAALDGIDLKGRTVGFVGHLPGHSGITDELLQPAKQIYILEKEPKPGDYPDSACEYLLPRCDLVVITGSAAVNKTMPRLLELCRNAQTVLTGPTVTNCPALLTLGIDRLNGRVITEPEPMLRAIVEKRTSVNKFSVSFQVDQ
ncbi:MAG: DUF364 domain-containing protein [Oscillospiraceae bacterium]|nr:DUF364 domain-containing protein [Oscillospiraceae bacterium]